MFMLMLYKVAVILSVWGVCLHLSVQLALG